MLLLAAPLLRYRKECDSTGRHLGQLQPLEASQKRNFTQYNSFTRSKNKKILSLTQALHIYMYACTYVYIYIYIYMASSISAKI